MTDRELMQQALHTLEGWANHGKWVWPESALEQAKRNTTESITALRERLAQPEPAPGYCQHCKQYTIEEPLPAQPEQEPVAWVTGWHDGHCVIRAANPAAILPIGIALYTTPPRREWVGMTEEEVDECYYWKGRQWTTDELVRHVEAKLKEKNA